MNPFQSLKSELQAINLDMSAFLDRVESMTGLEDAAVADWRRVCAAIEKQMDEDVIRVAVVGPIKSGKSTFINSLFRSDYLKRGAGVVTSIVTRIRSGPYLKATLFFKSWDEINAEIEQAMILFPHRDFLAENERFDIRRERDRRGLAGGLRDLNGELLISNGTRTINSILLESYLSGYDAVKELIGPESTVKAFEDDLFDAQKSFVGSDSLAVYLKDIQLDINSEYLESNIEMADCQGSDSPNPLHLAMIQDYLLKTHLIIYVVSSRTGLRQADIRFLTIIRQMGIIDNIVFLVNCDFSEHETLEDLKALVEKTRAELSLLKSDPSIFTLSSLYNLFKYSAKTVSSKDALRLAHWEQETELVAFSEEETGRFQAALEDKLSRERYRLLLKNNLERLGLISINLQNMFRVRTDLFSRDARGVQEMLKKIAHHQKQMEQLSHFLKDALDGASKKVKQELKGDVDRFFDARYGSVLQPVAEFVRNYQVDFKGYLGTVAAARFTDTLFLVFQDFKSALDAYLAETINPRIIKFVKEEEAKAGSYLLSVGEPFESMIADTVAGYHEAMNELGIALVKQEAPSPAGEAFKAVPGRDALSLPAIESTMRYSARIKAEAVVKLGAYSLVTAFKRLLKKEAGTVEGRRISALKDGVKRMKFETERSAASHFKDYRENLKFQYISKLTDAMSNRLFEILMQRFRSYETLVSRAMDLVREKHLDKETTLSALNEMEARSKAYKDRIDAMKTRVDAIFRTQATKQEG